MVSIKVWRNERCRFTAKREKQRERGERKRERLVIACTVSVRYRFRCELGTIWRRFEDDFISARRRPSGMLHVRMYVVHDASPFHVAAVPLAGNCRGDRSPLHIGRPRDALSGWHRRLRPEYFVREQGGIGLSPITRGHVREGREDTSCTATTHRENRARLSLSLWDTSVYDSPLTTLVSILESVAKYRLLWLQRPDWGSISSV